MGTLTNAQQEIILFIANDSILIPDILREDGVKPPSETLLRASQHTR